MTERKLLDRISEIIKRAFASATQESFMAGLDEMRQLAEEYKDNEDAVHEITAESEMLANQIEGDIVVANS